jgi:hypothetical protein
MGPFMPVINAEGSLVESTIIPPLRNTTSLPALF